LTDQDVDRVVLLKCTTDL